MFLVLSPASYAQDPGVTPIQAPPPMRFIPRSEREHLATAMFAKDRTRARIELKYSYLIRADGLTTARKHDSALIEIGNYLALVEDAIAFLGGLKRDSNRTRDLYKRLELALRAQGLRLAAIRRVTPAEYAGQIKAAEEFARDQRSEALKSFYGQTVVRESPDAVKKAVGEKPAKDPTPPGDPKRP